MRIYGIFCFTKSITLEVSKNVVVLEKHIFDYKREQQNRKQSAYKIN